MPIGDIERVVVYTQFTEQAGINVWYFRLATQVGGVITPVARANSIFAQFSPSISALMTSQATFVAVGVRKVFPLPMSQETLSDLVTIPGIGSGGGIPRQASGIITTLTGLAGRANRGRKYVPFPAEDANQVTAIPTAGYMTSLADYATAAIPLMTHVVGPVTETWNPIIFRTANPALSPNLIDFKTRNRWATQKRRGSYGVPNLLPA